MAKPPHRDLLIYSPNEWNEWRRQRMSKRIDLRGIQLYGQDLRRLDFTRVDLQGAVFSDSILDGSTFKYTSLQGAIMRRASLRGVDLTGANLYQARLERADLRSYGPPQGSGTGTTRLNAVNLKEADLTGVTLEGADLSGADLSRATLIATQFVGTRVSGANFIAATFGATIIAGCDLSETLNLNTAVHLSPSFISLDSLRLSHGAVDATFLRGCGLSEVEILTTRLAHDSLLSEAVAVDLAYNLLDLRKITPIQTRSVFISYSHSDSRFVDVLAENLSRSGIRYWRDVHDLRSGRIETQIDRAIRLNPIVVLILSGKSVDSDWVEWEASQARKLEHELGRDVLCPIALDSAWRQSRWPASLRNQIEAYHILDFSSWDEPRTFERQYARLIDGLRLFYPGATTA